MARRKRKSQPLVRTREAIIAHRELAYLRNPSRERAAKLKEIKRGQL